MRGEQLDAGSGVADGHHRLADALLLVGLLVLDLHPEGVLVERDRLVEVGYGDADVVDAGEQVGGEVQGSGHGGILAQRRTTLNVV